MIGNVRLVSITYRQFCGRVRRLCKVKPTRDELYREWCSTLRREGHIDYDRHARRIENRRKN